MVSDITEDIAELIGIHIGDGTFYKTGNSAVWEIRGDLLEKNYYVDNVCPLMSRVIGIEFHSKFRSGGANGCWGVQTSKKIARNFLLDNGFTPGRKTHTVKVPEYIFASSIKNKRAFVRGLFDTDGCLRFDRINGRPLHDYPKLEFGFASKDLRDTLQVLLKDLNFRNYVWLDKATMAYKICIAGKTQLERWIKEIEPRNPKHLNKYQIWKELGFYQKAEMAQSGTAQIIQKI
tara:strand:+ start:2959 stop:3657 length:699 start_codon:yes stop_codon:yes gene_type:complete